MGYQEIRHHESQHRENVYQNRFKYSHDLARPTPTTNSSRSLSDQETARAIGQPPAVYEVRHPKESWPNLGFLKLFHPSTLGITANPGFPTNIGRSPKCVNGWPGVKKMGYLKRRVHGDEFKLQAVKRGKEQGY